MMVYFRVHGVQNMIRYIHSRYDMALYRLHILFLGSMPLLHSFHDIYPRQLNRTLDISSRVRAYLLFGVLAIFNQWLIEKHTPGRYRKNYRDPAILKHTGNISRDGGNNF